MSSFDSERTTETDNDSPLIPEFNYLIINSISNILSSVIIKNKNLPYFASLFKRQLKLPFNAKYIPSISISYYITRIVQYTKIEENTLIASLIFIDRLCNEERIMLTEFNVHRIIFTACLLAIKVNEDQIFNMEYYSQICGVKLTELNKLESFFCSIVNFNFYIDEKEFGMYKQYLYTGAMMNQISYTKMKSETSHNEGISLKN